MIPTFIPGDHVLTFNWIKPKLSDVIVFYKEKKYFIKRVKKIEADLIYIEGDNVKSSASLGPIAKKQIRGRVILKY